MESAENARSETGAKRVSGWGWVCLGRSRTFWRIQGQRRLEFVQGLFTQDVNHATAMIFGAFLTPKGRFVADAFAYDDGASLWLETAIEHAPELEAFLLPYGLLHQVTVNRDDGHWVVCVHGQASVDQAGLVVWGEQGGSVIQADPRTPALGMRAWIASHVWPDFQACHHPTTHQSAYHAHRIALGIPDGSWDLIPHQSIILEYGYQHLHALSWTKGCYRGQELMARTHHRGLVRKHMVVLTLQSGRFPPAGTPLTLAHEDGALLGEVSLLEGGSMDETTTALPQGSSRGWMGGHWGKQGLACLPDTMLAGSDSLVLTYRCLPVASASSSPSPVATFASASAASSVSASAGLLSDDAPLDSDGRTASHRMIVSGRPGWGSVAS